MVGSARLPARALAKLPADLRAVALAEGIRAAGEDERCTLAAALIEVAALEHGERGRCALAQIAGLWEILPADARYAALAVGGERWSDLCRNLLADPDAQVRRRGLLLVGQCALIDMAEQAVDHLIQGEPAAEGAVVALARACEPTDDPARRAVEAAVARAAAAYADHRRTGVLLALAALMESPRSRRGPIGALLEDSSGPIAMAMRGLIRKDEEQRLAELVLVWLTHPALEPACRSWLARLQGAELARLAPRAHLLGNPLREGKLRSALAGAVQAETADRGIADAVAAGRTGVLRLAPLLAPGVGVRAVGAAIADPSPVARLTAVRAAASLGGEAGAACLADLGFDADARIAQAACTALLAPPAMRESSAARRTLAHLERSGHATVRATAARFAAAMRLGAGEGTGGRLRAQRAMAEDRAGFLNRLREKIGGASAAERLAAIQLAIRLGVCGEVELELLAALGRGGAASGPGGEAAGGQAEQTSIAHIVATAVRALGRVGSTASGAAVRACLRHADARVRANAVEALGSGGFEGSSGFPTDSPAAAAQSGEGHWRSHLLRDPHHRVRAAAVRSAVRCAVEIDGAVRDPDLAAAAGTAISGMLAHDDAMMRLSGLWALGSVAGRCPSMTTALAARVEDLSRTDADERVRVRAAALSERLMRGMRAGWAVRAWEGADPVEGRGGPDADDAGSECSVPQAGDAKIEARARPRAIVAYGVPRGRTSAGLRQA